MQNMVNQLKPMALEQKDLNKRHAAGIFDGGKWLSFGVNSNRTYNKAFSYIHGSSICCSTHAEIDALRKARCREKSRIL